MASEGALKSQVYSSFLNRLMQKKQGLDFTKPQSNLKEQSKLRFINSNKGNNSQNAAQNFQQNAMNSQQSIIQCPNCQTKYGIDGSQLNSIDQPRFHCSRCDTVFALDQVNQAKLQQTETGIKKQANDNLQDQSTLEYQDEQSDQILSDDFEEYSHSTKRTPLTIAEAIKQDDFEEEDLAAFQDTNQQQSYNSNLQEYSQQSSINNITSSESSVVQTDSPYHAQDLGTFAEQSFEEDHYNLADYQEHESYQDSTAATHIAEYQNGINNYNESDYDLADNEAMVVIPKDLEQELKEQQRNFVKGLEIPRSIDLDREWQAPHETESSSIVNDLRLNNYNTPTESQEYHDSHTTKIDNFSRQKLIQQELPLMNSERELSFPHRTTLKNSTRLSDIINKGADRVDSYSTNSTLASLAGASTADLDTSRDTQNINNAAFRNSISGADPDLERRNTSSGSYHTQSFKSLDQTPSASGAYYVKIKERRGWQAFVTFISPIAAFLVILIIASIYFQSNPEQADKIFSKILPSSSQPAPSGLEITNSSLQVTNLDSGDTLILISGTLANSSQSTLKDIIIEGTLFDENDKEITTIQVNASANLAKTRIKSLTLDMISKLQSSKGAKNYRLKPGQKSDFVFAAININPKKVKYYSTRIFSVRDE